MDGIHKNVINLLKGDVVMYCEKCGSPVQDGYQFCMNCGAKIVYESIEKQNLIETETEILTDMNLVNEKPENFEEVVDIEKTEMSKMVVHSGSCCPSCGFEYVEGEKYCIICGSNLCGDETKSVVEKVEDEEIPVQKSLFAFFNSNKVFVFVLKYGSILVLLYPLYLIMGRFDVFNNIYDLINNISIILYYAYYFALFALYANKNYIGLFAGLGLRFLNSTITALQSTTPIDSLTRMAIITVVVIYIYRELMTESQRKDLVNKFKF